MLWPELENSVWGEFGQFQNCGHFVSEITHLYVTVLYFCGNSDSMRGKCLGLRLSKIKANNG